MTNIKFNDWQEMALKKDTETIIKKLSAQESITFSLCWEIVIAVGAIIIDHLFDTGNVSVWVWVCCAVLAISPPFIALIVRLVKFLSAIIRVRNGQYDVRKFVDVFDNQICYWIMMCNSYNDLLQNTSSKRQDEKIFLYHEACYYINKIIDELYKMYPSLDIVFSTDHKIVKSNNLVGFYRLESLCRMLKQERLLLEQNIESFKDECAVIQQKDLNKEFDKLLFKLFEAIDRIFGTDLLEK